ncbi:MAG: VOC family protein [Granulosicoccus sp.]
MIKLSISIDVPDLVEGESFYVKALGCKKLRTQGDKMIVLSTDNAEIYLQERSEGTVAVKNSKITRTYERHWTPVHVDFLREDVNEVVAKVKELGGQHEGGESGDWGSIAHCVDPFGNGFCIINE